MSSTSRVCSASRTTWRCRSFGMRQDIYEYWHGGDPSRNRINLMRSYDQHAMMDQIKDLLKHPLPHGELP